MLVSLPDAAVRLPADEAGGAGVGARARAGVQRVRARVDRRAGAGGQRGHRCGQKSTGAVRRKETLREAVRSGSGVGRASSETRVRARARRTHSEGKKTCRRRNGALACRAARRAFPGVVRVACAVREVAWRQEGAPRRSDRQPRARALGTSALTNWRGSIPLVCAGALEEHRPPSPRGNLAAASFTCRARP